MNNFAGEGGLETGEKGTPNVEKESELTDRQTHK
jgi:hypothetical protein